MTTPTYEGRPLANPDDSVFDQGLQFDIATLVDRRQVLKLLGFGGLTGGMFAIVGCTPGALASPAASTTAVASAVAGTPAASAASVTAATAGPAASAAATSATATAAASCDTIPEETAGPFPGDGTNGPDVLTQSGVVRTDIRSSFANASGAAEGVPLTIKLAIQDVSNNCAPMAGAAVYLWHCDRDGNYSLYSQGVTDQNYLRGVQEAGSDGVATFESIFPGCYSGRWPHIHFEIYPTLAKAADSGNKIATSQIALPKDACSLAYATTGYSASVANLARVSLTSDNVFGDDGGVHELGTVTGDVSSGMTVTLNVPVRPA